MLFIIEWMRGKQVKSENPIYLKYFFKYMPTAFAIVIAICWPFGITREIASTTGRVVFLLLIGGMIFGMHIKFKGIAEPFIKASLIKLDKHLYLQVEQPRLFSKNISNTIFYKDISHIRPINSTHYKGRTYCFYEIYLKTAHEHLENPIVFFERYDSLFSPKLTRQEQGKVYLEMLYKLEDSKLDNDS